MSRDGGASWSNVAPSAVAEFSPVSHVEPSRTAAGTAYAAFDRHMFTSGNPSSPILTPGRRRRESRRTARMGKVRMLTASPTTG